MCFLAHHRTTVGKLNQSPESKRDGQSGRLPPRKRRDLTPTHCCVKGSCLSHSVRQQRSEGYGRKRKETVYHVVVTDEICRSRRQTSSSR